DSEMRLHLPEVSKTEIRLRFGGRKTLSEIESVRGRYGFVRRRNEAGLVALDSSLKVLRHRLVGRPRWIAVRWLEATTDPAFSFFFSLPQAPIC
ncbi:hypothetical protein PanWU01x14_082350, partial [Parasponia andersonii]